MQIIRTEYSFKKCFGHLDTMIEMCTDSALCIADDDNTYGHIMFSKKCKEAGIKPVFGVRLRYTTNPKQRTAQSQFVFIAKNDEGLQEIYRLVSTAYTNFFYFPRLYRSDLEGISGNIIVIQPDMNGLVLGDYKAITPADTRRMDGMGHVFVQDNYYPNEEDRPIYELLAGARKDAKSGGYTHFFENKLSAMHVVPIPEGMTDISALCNAEIQQAEMVKYEGTEDIYELCKDGAKKLNIDISQGVYMDRLHRALDMIQTKGYTDYFMIVHDMLRYANRMMLVGPGRGSAGASLVCYLLDITKVDPIEYDLLFERFIDINRFDLPDIDIDFPDSKRHLVIEYLTRKYGDSNVKNLANINRLKAKSAIDLFGMGLGVPKKDCENVKNAMIERSGGDARNAMCIQDTFNDTDPGKEFVQDYPEMRLVEKIENHAQHAGKHAAGIIVSNVPLTNFGSVTHESYAGVPGNTIMMDKKSAEEINLLKIDCLGLSCLSVLEEAAKLSGKKKDFYFDLDMKDAKTFQIFRDSRLNGIFQFEGQALKMLTRRTDISSFADIVAITALARPGALRSGGAGRFAVRKNGEEEPVYFGEKHKEITEYTLGVMVYQEQMMAISRDIAGFSWEDVGLMRTAASKSKGDSYFAQFEERFIKGCIEHSGVTTDEADGLWKDVQHAGSWIFNKAHAVAYGMLSYYTAYMKANYPLEFYAASLNHASSDESALRILRDGVDNDGIEYTPVDPDESLENWAVVDGKLLGGLTNIKGIAEKKAKAIIKARKTNSWTPAQLKTLSDPKTPFDILFPTQHLWGHIIDNPESIGLYTKPTPIKDLDDVGTHVIIGKLINRNLNDMNDYGRVIKRGYKIKDHNMYINVILEDDYDSVMCNIDRYDFERLGGRKIADADNKSA